MNLEIVPVKADSAFFSDAVSFLKLREYRAVSLASNLCADGAPSYPGKQIADFSCLLDEGGNIDGILLRTASGILLHCFREGADVAKVESRKEALTAFLRNATVRCVIGPGDDTRLIESALRAQPYQVVDYRLMRLETQPEPSLATLGSEYTLRRALTSDTDDLLPLQEGYEREEVLPPGDLFDRNVFRSLLLITLKKQHINLIAVEGLPVAKAGTNARGFATDQIGGVYTDPHWRGKNLATALVVHTAIELMSKGRKVVLFVKPQNASACRVYEKIGFLPDSPFRISYF